MDILEFLSYLVQVLFSGFSNFFSPISWALKQVNSVFSSFISLYEYCSFAIDFVDNFFDYCPDWLVPFFYATISFWLIIFVVKIGGD